MKKIILTIAMMGAIGTANSQIVPNLNEGQRLEDIQGNECWVVVNGKSKGWTNILTPERATPIMDMGSIYVYEDTLVSHHGYEYTAYVQDQTLYLQKVMRYPRLPARVVYKSSGRHLDKVGLWDKADGVIILCN